MKICLALLVLALAAGAAYAGHELTFYPSFYPQEVTVRFLAQPSAAAALLRKNALHAYVGGDPFQGSPAGEVRWLASLRGFVVLRFPRAVGAFAEPDSRCAAGAQLARTLGDRGDFVAHPYPVTPQHEDYVLHYDLAQKARERTAARLPRVRADGALGKLLAAAGVPTAAADADAVLEEVSLPSLLAGVGTRLDGWTGPPWLKEGWFHAWLLQSASATRAAAQETFRRRTEGGWQTAAERVGLERRLVRQLSASCERVVLGYTLRREPVNDAYNEGVENVAADSQSGLVSPIFVRTVKLKDFPWNGWLQVGVAGAPRAAWNPIAGFGDLPGQMVWAAVGDPALLLDPDNARFIANRARPISVAAATEAPADALAPATLRPAGAPVPARTKVVYRVLLSKAHDGQPLTVADIVYPYAFVARWGSEGGRDHDPEIERASALVRRTVAAVRVAGVTKEVKELGDLQLMYDVPEVEVYLQPALEARIATAIAPPWSPVPWPVMALMEQAVARGVAAFSERQAQRRGVPWLDLARDARQRSALSAIAAELERTAFVPEPLRALVTPEQARQRWAALRAFARAHGHFLVTAGPYMLGKVSADRAVLPVFRDFTYALGVGAFDQYPLPLRAFVTGVERQGDRLEIQADVESIEKAARSYKIVRDAFRPQPPLEKTREPLTVHWMVVDAGDEVAAAGASREVRGNRLVIDLAGRLRPGAYRVVLALALNGNLVAPEVKVVPYRVGD
ncbi:MAG TPA: hypothetical protein VHZ49_12995 [Methylomirabilota bacterium]|nr:hypothetical protein [Methylomirabilota bacterium]